MTGKATKRRIALLATLIMILFSGHALQTILPRAAYICLVAACAVAPFLIFEFKSQKLNKARGALLLFLLMITLTTIKELGKGLTTYLFIGAIVLIAYRFATSYEFSDMVNIFLKIMSFITIVSLIGYVLVNNTRLLDFLPLYKNTNGVEYGVGIIFNYITSVPERNCGMFWEPGLFATFLSISLVFEIAFNSTKINVLRIIIYLVGLITANSTAGFVLLVLSLILLLSKNSNDKMKYFLGSALVVLILGVSPLIIYNLDSIISNSFLAGNQYIEKLLSENLAEQTRTAALSVNINVFLENPFLGAGIFPNEAQIAQVSDTSTTTYLLSSFGVLGLSFTVLLIYGIFRQKNLNFLTKIIVTIICLIIINKEPHYQIMFTWCMIFYLLKNDKLHYTKEIEGA